MPRRGQRPRRVTVTRYELPDGTRCTKATPGAIPRKTTSDSYYAYFGRERVPLGTTDEGQAWQRLREEIRRRRDVALGLRDHLTDSAERPIADHVTAWLATLQDGGVSPIQRQILRTHVDALIAAAHWTSVAQIHADEALRALAQLVEDGGFGPQTRNHYLAHLKQFTRWLSRPSAPRLASDPLRDLGDIPIETDIRHARRAPTPEELGRLYLYLAAPTCPLRPQRAMTGPQRALGYKVCMATGLRANELRNLERRSFDLAGATVTGKTRAAKNKRRPVQPLPAWLVEELRVWFEGSGGLWSNFPARWPGRILTADLVGAGIEPRIEGPDGPLFFDFHSLRHGYITALAAQPGIDVRTLMELARHSDPKLTIDRYAKGSDERRRTAVEALPNPTPPEKPARPPESEGESPEYWGS